MHFGSQTSVWMDDEDLMMTDDQKAGLASNDQIDHEQRQALLLVEQEQAEVDLAVAQVCMMKMDGIMWRESE